ncbi:LIM domain-containing protein WLIM2b [Orobanche gracilis]
MSFIGTQQKCKACEKTVYPVELLSADGVSYHKSCFKCSHCKGTLKLSTYSSMEGVLYCKPHYEQLFKETGSFTKNFQSPAKSSEKLTPEFTRSPSKAAGMFSGTKDKCATCGKTAYPLEKRRWASASPCAVITLSAGAYYEATEGYTVYLRTWPLLKL